MDPAGITRAAAALMAARTGGQPLRALPPEALPADEADAYRIQEAYVAQLLAAHPGARRVGYKAGCTNRTAQAQLGLAAPFRGILLSPFVLASPATVPCDAGFMRMIEAEVAFRMAVDLPVARAPFDAVTVRQAVAAALPAIEVVDSRYADWTTAGAPQLIADNGCTGFWVHGAEHADPGALELDDLPVQVRRNGQVAERGNTGNVLGNPFNSLHWLANHLAAHGRALRAGDLVTTGTTIEVNPAAAGDRVEAEFGPLGRVAVEFV